MQKHASISEANTSSLNEERRLKRHGGLDPSSILKKISYIPFHEEGTLPDSVYRRRH